MTFRKILVNLPAVLVSLAVFVAVGEIAVRIYTRTHILRNDGHFTAEGNRVAGELLYAWLLDQGLIPES